MDVVPSPYHLVDRERSVKSHGLRPIYSGEPSYWGEIQDPMILLSFGQTKGKAFLLFFLPLEPWTDLQTRKQDLNNGYFLQQSHRLAIES